MNAGQILAVVIGSLLMAVGLTVAVYAWYKLFYQTITDTPSHVWVGIRELLEEFVRTHGF